MQVFHAGTEATADGRILAAGGRVLTVCASAPDLRAAREAAYKAIAAIEWPEGFCRRDIGWRALTSEYAGLDSRLRLAMTILA